MKHTRVFFLGFVIMVTVLFLTGCSVTGWTVKEPPKGLNIDEGELVTVIRTDGSSHTGEYAGLEMIPYVNYIEDYQSRSQTMFEGKLLPTIGQNVQVMTSLSDAKHWEGQFVGFDNKNLWIKMKGKSDPEMIYFSALTSFSSRDGEVFRRSSLRSMFIDGKIPLMSAIILKNKEEKIVIPVSTIEGLALYRDHDSDSGQLVTMDGNMLRKIILQ